MLGYKLKKQYRLPEYNYSSDGYYYVTICTKEHQCVLGEISEGQMHLSKIGEIVKQEWLKTPSIRQNVQLDDWVIMPNHFHGIVVIQHQGLLFCRNAPRRVPTIGPLFKNSLSSIINHFKGAVTTCCHQVGFSDFTWQSRFYDQIIRHEKSLPKIRQYICNNLQKWDLDRNNPINFQTKKKHLVD